MKDITTKEKMQLKSNLGEPAYYTVTGNPSPKTRPRFGNGRVYDNQKDLKSRISYELKSQHDYVMPFEGPLKLEVTFFMPLPQRLRRKNHTDFYPPHSVKPDLDNLLKLLLDACNGVIIKDDALVSCIVSQKVYSQIARTELTITRLEPNGAKEDLDRKS